MKVVLAVVPRHRESTRAWSEVLRHLKKRGLGCARLVVGDRHLRIWGPLRNVYPQATEQRRWNHKILNVPDKLPKRQQDSARQMLGQSPQAQTRYEAERRRDQFKSWCEQHDYTMAAGCVLDDWERMMTFCDFPKWKCSSGSALQRKHAIFTLEQWKSTLMRNGGLWMPC